MLQNLQKLKTGTIRVFIVDDYKLSRIGLRFVLNEDEQLNVVGEAESAEAALEMIQTLRPDIVLMDLGLPGMNGIEATRAIKEYDENIKVIVLTSREEEEDVVAALKAGAHAYCLKNSASKSIIDIIKEVSSGAAWLDSTIASLVLSLFRKSGVMEKPAMDSKHGVSFNIELTEREFDILRLIAEGKGYLEDSGSPE